MLIFFNNLFTFRAYEEEIEEKSLKTFLKKRIFKIHLSPDKSNTKQNHFSLLRVGLKTVITAFASIA